MSILNVNQIQPVGSGQTITISASDITASSATITANTFTGNLTGNVTSSSTSTFSSGLNVTGGSVGIGTDNPATTFVVDKSDSSGLTAHILVNNSESSSGVSLLGAGSAFSSPGWPAITDSAIIRSSAGSANGIAYHASNGYHSFWSGAGTPAERLRITSSGNVGIGTDNPYDSKLQVFGKQRVSASAKNLTTDFFILSSTENSSNSNDLIFRQRAADNDWEIEAVEQGIGYRNIWIKNGNLKFTSGKGIDFSATSDATGMTSELLDDYEEGTWVPRLSGTGGGDYTPGGSNVGYYVKVGNLIKVSCTLHWTAQVTAYTGNLVITGLPYASRDTYRHAGTISAIASGLTLSTNYNRFSITHDPSASQAYIIQNKTDGNGYAHSAGTVATSGLIYSIAWTYVTT